MNGWRMTSVRWLGLLCGLMLAFPVQAVIPRAINFQGYLTDSTGAPLEGSQNISFCLYTTDVGGTPQWCDTQAVMLSQGLFDVVLDESTTPFPAGLFDTPLYLGLNVNGDGEMSPRIVLSSEGYAFHADDADTVGGQSASSLDQSADLAAHVSNPSAHHVKTTSFGELVDTASDAQIPAAITRDSELAAHVGDTANPHDVTAAQVGADPIGSAAAVQGNLDAHTANASAHHTRYTDAEATAAVHTMWPALVNPAGSGSGNTAHGINALSHNTTGGSNTAAGSAALYLNTTGGGNTAIGSNALYSNSTGSVNTAIGVQALQSNTTGSSNTAIGAATLIINTTGHDNTANGQSALAYNQTGNYNTAIGNDALVSNTTGNNNTVLGYLAGESNTAGSGNVFLGYRAGYAETGSNTLYIANNIYGPPLIYGVFSAAASGNKLGIGTAAVSSGDAIGTWTGAHLTTGGVWTNASSRELKENIRPLEVADALTAIDALKPMRYNYKVDKDEEYVGFIAEDVPELVATNNRKSLAAMDIVAVLTQVVKVQKAQIATQNEEIATAKARIAEQETEIAELQDRVKDIAALKIEVERLARMATAGRLARR